MTSPSEPVESPEQPREWPIHWVNDQKLDDLHALWHDQPGNMMGERECGWEHCEFWIMAQFTLDIALPVELHHRLAERDASIRSLETLRDVHRRTIDELVSEAQTAGATIDELRAERDDWHGRFKAEARLVIGTRGQLAAALAEVSRLREQGAAAMAIVALDEFDAADKAALAFIHGYNEARRDFRALLNPAREGE